MSGVMYAVGSGGVCCTRWQAGRTHRIGPSFSTKTQINQSKSAVVILSELHTLHGCCADVFQFVFSLFRKV